MTKPKDNLLHLHWGWDDPAQVKRDPLHTISIGIGACGAGNLPRGTFFNDTKKVTCPRCLEIAKQPPKPQPPAPEPEPAPKRQRANKLSDEALDGMIVKIKDNPKRPGTAAHTRWTLLLEFAGKSVKEFAKAGGNLTTLRNAIEQKIVKVNKE